MATVNDASDFGDSFFTRLYATAPIGSPETRFAPLRR